MGKLAMPHSGTVLIAHGNADQRHDMETIALASGFEGVRSCDFLEASDAVGHSLPDILVVEHCDTAVELIQSIRRRPEGHLTAVLLVAGRRWLTDPDSLLRETRADDILPAPPSCRATRLHLATARRLVHERRKSRLEFGSPEESGEESQVGGPSSLFPGPVARLLSRVFRSAARGPEPEQPEPPQTMVCSLIPDPSPADHPTPRPRLLLDLEEALLRARRREQTCLALLLLNLDRFRQINFDLGHAAGDRLLLSVGDRLASCLRSSDMLLQPENPLIRLGGDEFAMILEGIRDQRDAAHVAERLLHSLQHPFEVAAREVFLTASIGIGISTPDGDRPEDLFSKAERAMYEAKAQGKACYSFYSGREPAKGAGAGAVALETELRRALEDGSLGIRLQPIVSLFTGTLAGFEALSRWRRSDAELLLPNQYIPLAEEAGLIAALDRLALREACRQLRAWSVRFRHEALVPIAVNISGRHLTKPDLLMEIDRTLRLHGLSGRLLRLEITESTFMEGIRFADELFEQLHRMGISLSLDDFGTGYSSLSTLRRFAVDTLKVDAGFVARMREDEDSREIVRAIVNLARNLGKEAVAEGVETHSQLEMLRKMGCQFGQGFLISVPLELDAATDLLAEHLNGKPVVPDLEAPALC